MTDQTAANDTQTSSHAATFITRGRLAIHDPCYDADARKRLGADFQNMKPGVWFVGTEDCGGRCASLTLEHADFKPTSRTKWADAGEVGVDTARLMLAIDRHLSMVVPTGYGDGLYPVQTVERRGKVMAIAIDFL